MKVDHSLEYLRNDFVGSFSYLHQNLFSKSLHNRTEMKINEISSKVLSKFKSQPSYPPLNLKRILEEN